MKTSLAFKKFTAALFLLHGLAALGGGLQASQLGTAFTYQGRLTDGGNAAKGIYDLRFGLFNAVLGGGQAGNLLTNKNVAISNGLFTASLDFGAGIFDGTAYWLEIGVRTNGSLADFTPVSPRQPLTPSPYALFATSAGAAGIAAMANGVAPNSVTGANLQNSTITAPKIAPGQVVKSLNSLQDDIVLNVQAPLALSTNGNALQLSASGGLSWNLSGNGATTGANFLGTLDNQPLELRVNNARVLRLEPTSDTPNFIAGFSGNYVQPGLPGATIGGGGTVIGNQPNVVTNNGYYATIAGGYRNAVGGYGGAILGGSVNVALGNFDTIGGGQFHTASGAYDTIAGGFGNQATNDYSSVAGGSGNTAGGLYSSVGGGYGNVASGVSSVVAGGGIPFIFGGSFANSASGDYGVVSGGVLNFAKTNFCTVGGGGVNTASGFASVVVGGGGLDNNFNSFGNMASGDWSFVGGGSFNLAGGKGSVVVGGGSSFPGFFGGTVYASNVASGDFSAIVGGNGNIALGQYTTVSAGSGNTASNDFATAAGGSANAALGPYSTISGGQDNLALSDGATVGGGRGNRAGSPPRPNISGYDADTVGGGSGNVATNGHATVAGGLGNVANGRGTVGGGEGNNAGSGTIPGGYYNRCPGGTFAAGDYASANNGSIVFSTGLTRDSDGAFVYFESSTFEEFAAFAYGGFRFVTDHDPAGNPTTGVVLPHADGSWHSLCDRNAKTEFAPVNGREILDRLSLVPIQTWCYKGQTNAIRHIGPMAQDFSAAFKVGLDDKHIATVDADGVALAAIQGLHELVKEKDAKISALERRLADLEKLVTNLAQKQSKDLP